MARMFRHWRQRWNPSAVLCFRRRMTLGETTYLPGDVIPEALKKSLGHRLRVWWDNQIVEIKNFSPSQPLGAADAQQEDLTEPFEVEVNLSLPLPAEAVTVPSEAAPAPTPEVKAKRKPGRPRKNPQTPAS